MKKKFVVAYKVYGLYRIIKIIIIYYIYQCMFLFQILKAEAVKYKDKGNDLFKSEEYQEAISVYTQGLRTCPLAYSKERSILYANRAAAKLICLVMMLFKEYRHKRLKDLTIFSIKSTYNVS